jgi:hypothetical protein
MSGKWDRLDDQWYSEFRWRDWLSDPCLRRVSFAAKGMWMDMLAFMHEDAERGFLTVNGRAATTVQIAKMLGAEARQVARLLDELEANGVFSRDDRGAIFSRRMVRDIGKSLEFSARGKQGGNPELLKNSRFSKNGLNPRHKPEIEILKNGDDSRACVRARLRPKRSRLLLRPPLLPTRQQSG